MNNVLTPDKEAFEKPTTKKIENLFNAMFNLQSEIKNPIKNAYNPFHKSKYADLPSILDYIKPLLQKNNLLLIQSHDPYENGVKVITKLLHVSGESFDSTLQFPVEKQTPQGYGSAITYARRYAILSLLCISADDDDDGNENEKHNKQEDLTIQDRILKAYKDLSLTFEEIEKFEARFEKKKLLDILNEIGKTKYKAKEQWTEKLRNDIINGYIGE